MTKDRIWLWSRKMKELAEAFKKLSRFKKARKASGRIGANDESLEVVC